MWAPQWPLYFIPPKGLGDLLAGKVVGGHDQCHPRAQCPPSRSSQATAWPRPPAPAVGTPCPLPSHCVCQLLPISAHCFLQLWLQTFGQNVRMVGRGRLIKMQIPGASPEPGVAQAWRLWLLLSCHLTVTVQPLDLKAPGCHPMSGVPWRCRLCDPTPGGSGRGPPARPRGW